MEFLTVEPKPRKFFRAPNGYFFDPDAVVALHSDTRVEKLTGWGYVNVWLRGGPSLSFRCESDEEAENLCKSILDAIEHD